jgi:molybdopterin/thiamine biosynthesis adenylyltransferase
MTATDKNLRALIALFGNAGLADRIQALRVGVLSDDSSNVTSGRLTAEALGDALGRLWVSIDAAGPLATHVLESAANAAASGKKPLDARESWSPPYDVVVVLGRQPSGDIGPLVRVGADGWVLYTGAVSRFGDSPVPVGPAFAAGVAGAEVFKIAFAPELRGKARALGDVKLNLLNFGRPTELAPPSSIILPRTHSFGVGAVTHGLLWVFERWPGEVSGELLLIDPDSYDASNGQRYAGMTALSAGPKSKVKAEILRARHPQLKVEGFEIDGDTYFDRHEPIPNVLLAVAGVDSKEMRRHIALKLPSRVINMWTEGSWLGAARFGGGDGWPCLMCRYPEPKDAALDDVTRIHRATGLSPLRVRTLLDGDNRLTALDAATVAQHRGAPPERMAGRPVWSVIQELCATGSVQIPGQSQNADVPFAFSSLLAGVAGFINLAQEISGVSAAPFDWSYEVLDRPHANTATATAPLPDCMLCGRGCPPR